MNILGILIIVALIAAVAIGFIVGLVKGFTKVKSWGVEFLLTAALSIGIGGICAGSAANGGEEAIPGGIVTIIFTLVFVIAFQFLFKLLRWIFRKLIKRRLDRATEEMQSDNGEEEEEYDSGYDEDYDDDDDEYEYEPPKKKKKNKKPSAGFVGFLNRILGAVVLAIKGFVLVGAISAFALVALDLTQLDFVTEKMADLYGSESYMAFKPALMDFFVVGIISIAINCGFDSGVSNTIWGVIVIGLIVLAGFAAFHMAFDIESFKPAIDGIANLIAGEGEVSDLIIKIAQAVLAVGIFLIMLVIIILLSIFVPKLMTNLQDSTAFNVIDGVLGAIFSLVLVLGILLGIGAFLQPICEEEFMTMLSSYFEESEIATYFYDNDLLALMGVNIPIREWLGLAQ